jgi:transitional endoplasmic reticulum ATPase
VARRVDRYYFTEVYQMSDGRYLYLNLNLPDNALVYRAELPDVLWLSVNGRRYPCMIMANYSRECIISVVDALTRRRGLHCVAGMRDLKALLISDVIEPLRNPEKYKRFKLAIPNGILLFGPPGCGKTFIAKKLAEELSYSFHELSPSSVATPWVHGAVSNIAKVFDAARQNAPGIIFIDEIEGLVPKREELGSHADIKKEEVNEFLIQLNNAGNRNVLVIGATNRPQMIDTAILRSGRMDKRIFVGPPDFDARKELLKMSLSERPHSPDIDYNHLAEITENYVGSDIELIVTESAREAVKDNRAVIDQPMLLQAIQRVTRSVPQSEIDAFVDLAKMERY